MIFSALHSASCTGESRSRRRTGAVQRAAPLGRIPSAQPAHGAPNDPVILRQKESGHRVANLLQVVLCNLEQTASGPGTLTIAAVRDQVSAVCQLQHLLETRCADEQSAADHVRALGKTLETLLLRPAGAGLTIEVDAGAEELLLPARTLSELGQLVAEAVMNAAKHAFPARDDGSVVLRLSMTGAGLSCAIVDDGVGSRGSPRRIGSRGMILSEALARRAGGNCAWVFGQHGTVVQITWPIPAGFQEA